MPTFVVAGGRRLSGSVRPAGNKNAALPVLAATLMSGERVVVRNVPRIRDVVTLLEIMESLGARVAWTGPNDVEVNAADVAAERPDRALAERIRASVLLAGPLLARFGKVSLPPPGGDVIGRRRLDTHLLAFQALGGSVDASGDLTVEAPVLRGADVFLDEPSVTATENAVMAATLAEGETTIAGAGAVAISYPDFWTDLRRVAA